MARIGLYDSSSTDSIESLKKTAINLTLYSEKDKITPSWLCSSAG